jgi:hypothetical protein
MNTSGEVSIGGRRQVLEDEDEVCNSESNSENEEGYLGDKPEGMYTSEIKIGEDGRPVNSWLYRLSSEQASTLRAGTTRCAGESKGPTHRNGRGSNEYERDKA